MALLGEYGTYEGSEQYPFFRTHTDMDIALDRPWTFYDYLEPLTIHYDGGISLFGIALGQGIEQLSSKSLFNIGHDRS